MPDVFRRIIKAGGKLQYVRGNSGYLGDAIISRDALVSGTYDPGDYAGQYNYATMIPSIPDGTTWDTRRVGFFGWDTITSEQTTDTALTYSVNGETVMNTAYYRRIGTAAKDLDFINCVFMGSLRENNAMVTSSNANCERLKFTDCTFAPLAPQQSTTGWKGLAKGTTFERCDFYGAGDLMGNSGFWQDMNIINCAFHDQAYFAPDRGAAGGIDDNATHTDCIQWTGGNLNMVGNSIKGFYDVNLYQAADFPQQFTVPEDRPGKTPGANRTLHMFGNKYRSAGGWMCNTSCMMISPNLAPLGNVNITKNFIDGGAVPFNLGAYYSATSFTISDNIIGNTRRDHGPTWGDQSKMWRVAIAGQTLQGYITTNNNRRATDNTVIDRSLLFERGID